MYSLMSSGVSLIPIFICAMRLSMRLNCITFIVKGVKLFFCYIFHFKYSYKITVKTATIKTQVISIARLNVGRSEVVILLELIIKLVLVQADQLNFVCRWLILLCRQ